MSNIKGLLKPEDWEKAKKINSQDGYSNAVVSVAEKVMLALDDFKGEFNIGYNPDLTTPHGIICSCDDEGITGFQAGAVRNYVAHLYKDGWKFALADCINTHMLDNQERIDKLLKSFEVGEVPGFNKKDGQEYIDELIARFKEKDLV